MTQTTDRAVVEAGEGEPVEPRGSRCRDPPRREVRRVHVEADRWSTPSQRTRRRRSTQATGISVDDAGRLPDLGRTGYWAILVAAGDGTTGLSFCLRSAMAASPAADSDPAARHGDSADAGTSRFLESSRAMLRDTFTALGRLVRHRSWGSVEARGAGSVPERGGDPPPRAAVDPARDRGHRRDRHRGHRRRLHRPHRRGRPRARRHPLRAARPQPGPGPLLPRRRQLRPRASAPTSSSTPTATTSTRRSASPTWSARSSRVAPTSSSPTARCTSSSTSPRQEGAAEARQPGRQPGRRHRAPRRGERLPRLLARQPDAAEHGHPLQLLHGDDHPGRQQAAAASSLSRSSPTRRPASRGSSRRPGSTC